MYLSVQTYVRTDKREEREEVRVSVEISWPGNMLEELEKIKKLAGHEKFSKLVRHLLLDWLEQQEDTIKNNPIGLRYSVPGRHWIDSLCELDLKTISADLALLEDQKQISRIFAAAAAIKDSSNRRSMEIWKMTKEVVFKS